MCKRLSLANYIHEFFCRVSMWETVRCNVKECPCVLFVSNMFCQFLHGTGSACGLKWVSDSRRFRSQSSLRGIFFAIWQLDKSILWVVVDELVFFNRWLGLGWSDHCLGQQGVRNHWTGWCKSPGDCLPRKVEEFLMQWVYKAVNEWSAGIRQRFFSL